MRKKRPFIAINCGAIPSELLESELFGHEKGAFTGADRLRKGYFESADGGTLFLDEIGELPFFAQVKLLRVLQEGEVIRIGSSIPHKIDVRIIAATNRNLLEEIESKNFRADLFYRLAVAILKLPPLRDRSGDMGPLTDHFLEQINRENKDELGYKYKKISSDARNIMLQYSWPGNVRELMNTLQRAVIWSEEDILQAEDIRDAMVPLITKSATDILNHPLGKGFNLPELISNISKHYLCRALAEAGNNKTKAAKLVGLPSYQTLTNWLRKYDLL
jgi:transcriptional regulator with PAS, ATPase and Fis domain